MSKLSTVRPAHPRIDPGSQGCRAIARLLPHGICFALPLANLAFLATGPHAWDAALIWTLPVWLCIYADLKSPAARAGFKAAPERLFDAGLHLLFLLQLVNIGLLLQVAGQLAWSSLSDFLTGAANIAAMRILSGTNSCCSGIAVAHELIHRRAYRRWMGRILLWTVCYDHFMIEHLQGHHLRAGTAEDPATARFGESFREFWRRSPKQQFLSAWRLENRRLKSLGKASLRHHRALHGLIIQAALLTCISICFGPVSLLMFLYQALVAVQLLETVNYFQHWGLARGGGCFTAADAWSSDSWFTLHAFIGLSRHADHHAHGGKPFQRLQSHEESPRLPHGYFVMAITAKLFNTRYRWLAEQELRARQLGPFRNRSA